VVNIIVGGVGERSIFVTDERRQTQLWFIFQLSYNKRHHRVAPHIRAVRAYAAFPPMSYTQKKFGKRIAGVVPVELKTTPRLPRCRSLLI